MYLMVAGDVMEEPGLVALLNRDPGLAEETDDGGRSSEVCQHVDWRREKLKLNSADCQPLFYCN